MEALDVWVSDANSFFAHLPFQNHGYGHRHTWCGITLGEFNTTAGQMMDAAVGKPRCSSCEDRMRVTQG